MNRLNIQNKALTAGSLILLMQGGFLSSPASSAERSKTNLNLASATTGGISQKDGRKSFLNAEGSGTLKALDKEGKEEGSCPLKHTAVTADIAGYIARVTVKQTFTNPFTKKIEAVYTFPLSENGAVDEMLMKIGSRTIHGTIKKREEARQIYEDARQRGYAASLLEQERSNIFTQSVANIEPGKDIEVTISYIETLPFDGGKYTFTFPTVVGPRFMGSGLGPDSAPVPDASRISPPLAAVGERAGHDISIDINLDAGMGLSNLNSALHQVNIEKRGESKAHVNLVDQKTIPNKDFVLSWNVAQEQIKSGYLTYKQKADKDGYFTLMVMPPKRVTAQNTAPKELIFVIDCSGSQSGAPLQKAKDAMLYMLEHMNANDTFQIITFNNSVEQFPDKPEQAGQDLKQKARDFIEKLQARGGTWMAPAVEKACSLANDAHRLRIITFMTDGYVGNDFEILGLVKKMRGNSRWFPFGTGNSVNRMLIDGMAKEGGGEAEYVLLNSSAETVGKKFYERIGSPVLTDVKLSFSDGLEVKDVYPREVSDVYAERPLYFKGRYTAPRAGTITLTGYQAGKPYSQTIKVDFPNESKENKGVPSLWARAKVDRLMSEDWFGAQQGQVNKELKEEIVDTALKHHIMTKYTSFVAVDDSIKTKGEPGEKVNVPVEMPDGVSREAIFGRGNMNRPTAAPVRAKLMNLTNFAYSNFGNANLGSVNYGGAAAGVGIPGGFMTQNISGVQTRQMQSFKKRESDRKDQESSAAEASPIDKGQAKDKDQNLVLTIKIKTATLTAKNKKALKALGATIISQGKEIKLSLPASKLKELAKLDFIVSVKLIEKE
ncbi:MAG: Vault protein inter-alpha-trypsin [bacterium ADurb.Bin425]|nr:MAG: Vault protein inter-alpha-trypsin [bacterium ADurb.Bin425]